MKTSLSFLVERAGLKIFYISKNYFSLNSVERAEWDGNSVTSTKVINNHVGSCARPIVFEAAPDQCKHFCSDNFCYTI
jgi:hypothetical protein